MIDVRDLLTLTARRAQRIDDAPRCIEQEKIGGASGELRDERPILCVADRVVSGEGEAHDALALVFTEAEQTRAAEILTQGQREIRGRKRLLFEFAHAPCD